MTDTPNSPKEGGTDGDDEGAVPAAETVYEAMEPHEPYTTGELASTLGAPRRLLRGLLNRLAEAGTIRKEEAGPERVVWIREPPRHECPNCGGEFEIRYFHPIFQTVQFCPTCGARLRRKERD